VKIQPYDDKKTHLLAIKLGHQGSELPQRNNFLQPLTIAFVTNCLN